MKAIVIIACRPRRCDRRTCWRCAAARRAGMPSEDVLKRATERAREQEAKRRAIRARTRTQRWVGARAASHTSRGSTKRWQSHQRFLARRCLRYTASQRMPIFSSTRIDARVVDIDGRYHPLGAQIEKSRIDQGQRDFCGDIPCPILALPACSPSPPHCFRSGTNRRRRSAAPRRFLPPPSSKRVRGCSRCEASSSSRYSAVLSCIAGTEEEITRDARIRRVGVHRVEVRRHELAQIQPRRANRHAQFAHNTLPGFNMPFGSSACFSSRMTAEFHRIRAAREFRCLEPTDAMFGADAAAEALHQIEHRMLQRVCPRPRSLRGRRRVFG